MILVIDNYDSFTFNIVQYLRIIGLHVEVARNNQITLDYIDKIDPDCILISPGPGNPNQAGLCLDIVNIYCDRVPILGVCLGHQIIAQTFGGKIIRAERPMHGKVSRIKHDNRTIFSNLKNPLSVTRYHSLIVDSNKLPNCLEVSAVTEKGEIMAIRHKDYNIEGVQFHPESIMTEEGIKIFQNFFNNIKLKTL